MFFNFIFEYVVLFWSWSCVIEADTDGLPAVRSIILSDSRGLPSMASLS